jgi:hypothetical protein
MAAFHFKERLKLFGKSAAAIIADEKRRRFFEDKIGRIIRNYTTANKRIMRYRNFVVHGPEGREDEFADLRSCELAGLFLHGDLWFEYNNEFGRHRTDWTLIARNLIGSMEISIAAIQQLNENLITERAFDFCAS